MTEEQQVKFDHVMPPEEQLKIRALDSSDMALMKEQRKKIYLVSLGDAFNNHSKACAATKIASETIKKWKKEDPAFMIACEEIANVFIDAAEEELLHRAMGYQKAIIFQGKAHGFFTEHSDLCLMFWLKANKPDKYRESKVDTSITNEVNIGDNSKAQVNDMLKILRDNIKSKKSGDPSGPQLDLADLPKLPQATIVDDD